jgi:hypothetical protein
VKADVSHEEDDPYTKGLQARIRQHVEVAMNRTEKAIGAQRADLKSGTKH